MMVACTQAIKGGQAFRYHRNALSARLAITTGMISAINVTVDDSGLDPITGKSIAYAPPGRWNSGNGCDPCTAKPNPGLTVNASWHDATYDGVSPGEDQIQTASFQFNGSAIYAVGIIAQSSTSPRGFSDILFFIDNQQAGNFVHTPLGTPNTYNYNTTLFTSGPLKPGQHTFSLQNGRPEGNVSLVMLDYLVYTRDDGSLETASETATPTEHDSLPPNPSPTHMLDSPSSDAEQPRSTKTVIIAVVVPSVVLVIIALACFFIWRRRRASRQQEQWDTIDVSAPREQMTMSIDTTSYDVIYPISTLTSPPIGQLHGGTVNTASAYSSSNFTDSINTGSAVQQQPQYGYKDALGYSGTLASGNQLDNQSARSPNDADPPPAYVS